MPVAPPYRTHVLLWLDEREGRDFSAPLASPPSTLFRATGERLGNGASILFWKDKWLCNEPLEHSLDAEILEGELEKKVNEYWTEEGGGGTGKCLKTYLAKIRDKGYKP